MFIAMRRNSGFTLVELMVGLVVGLLVMGGVFGVYINTLKTSGVTLKSSRLNQEMNTIMAIMANDIRRAGYWGDGALNSALDNPFSRVGTTALEVHENSSGTFVNAATPMVGKGNGGCIVYTYDLDKDGFIDPGANANDADTDDRNEGFGFRWSGTAGDPIMMKIGHTDVNDCSSTGETWRNLTDPAFMRVTNVNFSLINSQCLNTSEPNLQVEATGAPVAANLENPAEADCYLDVGTPGTPDYPPSTGEVTVVVREVLITLKAELVSDPEVALELKQSVQVRNNLVIQN